MSRAVPSGVRAGSRAVGSNFIVVRHLHGRRLKFGKRFVSAAEGSE